MDEEGSDNESGMPLEIILLIGGIGLFFLCTIGCICYCCVRGGCQNAEQLKKEIELALANIPKIPPPIAYQNQRKSNPLPNLLQRLCKRYFQR